MASGTDFLDEFLGEVENYLSHSDLTPSAFGLKAAGDPNFVFDLRSGREPRRSTREKVREFINRTPPASRGTHAASAA